MANKGSKFGFNATWSMAVGGMVGGGIFSVLGVVVQRAGQWAWLSFLLSGLIALISAHSYNQLSLKYKKSGGSFTFLNELHYKGIAASLSWVLILGYILTLSVYAFTFGHYVAHVINLGSWFPRVLALLVILTLTFINIQGVGESSKVEIITVWGKLFVLLGLALLGVWNWQPEALTAGISSHNWASAITGAATIFMAYEGFQLLSYDYEDISDPQSTLPKATISAVIVVILIYILVALGATMLVGAEKIIQQKEIALAAAGQQALGTIGVIVVTVAAAFSTGSAINATLFSTSRLMESVAKQHDLPSKLAKENNSGIPAYAIFLIAGFASVLAIIGSLATLVDAASLIFLLTFGVVNFIAYYEKLKYKYLSLIGTVGCAAAIVLSSITQLQQNPYPLVAMLILIFIAFIIRPYLLKRIN